MPTAGDLSRFALDAGTLGVAVEILYTGQESESLDLERVATRLETQENFWLACLPGVLEQKVALREEPVCWRCGSGGPTRVEVLARVQEDGLQAVDRCEHPGTFSRRGGLMDLWAAGEKAPWRFDWFGDTLESIHVFNPATQRRGETITELLWRPRSRQQRPWTELVPAGLPLAIFDKAVEGEPIPQCVTVQGLTFGEPRWDTSTTDTLQGQFVDRVGRLKELAQKGHVHLFFETPAGQEQFFSEAPELRSLEGIQPHIGRLSEGIRFGADTWINAHGVFGKTPVRRQTPWGARDPEGHLLSDLKDGDLVVHVGHGIARYRGNKFLEREGVSSEFMALEFADRTRLYVPATQMDRVQRYVGSGPQKPPLSRLGGTRWEKQKEKVAEAVDELARELLDLQARRQRAHGIAFPPADDLQLRFAAAFPHEETADQLRVLTEIDRDMEAPSPMDRLLCGDVGYGKTEIAMRAAFKAVCGGKQVCLMAPTTVLVEQHLRTFRERFADFPLRAQALSRLTPPRQRREVLEGLQTGQIDIVIGTHKLLGRAVQFLDLGLVIVDEEQRFGVRHKEALKRWRLGVDFLTLTATPIPRTLHMALLGLRDISNLMTPPVDRQAVSTRVTPPSVEVVREALRRELERGGQAFVLHNRVRSLDVRAESIRRLAPRARVVWAHGQMPPRELERVMLDMVRHEIDVLVCTTIISNGVDIPNVNTILIDDAQRFGLAELHQLRGRVGRADRQGVCRLFLPAQQKVGEAGRRRLKAMEEYADLGAGFQIALRDLEIRGAGNILGAEQSGHIMTIGYELYCQLLDEAVRRHRLEPIAASADRVSVDLPLAAYLPEEWTGSRREKITALRRLLAVPDLISLESLVEEFADRFGRFPEPFANLLDVLRLKILLAPLGVRAVGRGHEGVFLKVERFAPVVSALAPFAGRVRPDPQEGRIWLNSYGSIQLPHLLRELLRALTQSQAGDSSQRSGFDAQDR